MTATAQALRPPSRTLLLLEGRALQELGAFMLLRPWLAAAPRGDGHPVLVLPGLLASDFSTQPLRSFLKAQGYAVHGWKQGRNLGLRPGVEPDMLERVEELYDRHGGRKLSLVGWSLGGIYARQLAKRLPDKVRCVISLGSPFTGNPKATNAWKVYEFASGQRVEDSDEHIAGPLSEPPPVPTTSPSMPSPTGWPSPKASGRSSTAPAGRASCFRTGGGTNYIFFSTVVRISS